MSQLCFVLTLWLFVKPFSALYTAVLSFKVSLLKWRYGGVRNIPVDKMPAIPTSDGPVDRHFNNVVMLIGEYNYLCQRLGVPLDSTEFGKAVARLLNGTTSSLNEYEGLHRIVASKHRRRDMLDAMIRLGDLSQRRMDYICETDPHFREWVYHTACE